MCSIHVEEGDQVEPPVDGVALHVANHQERSHLRRSRVHGRRHCLRPPRVEPAAPRRLHERARGAADIQDALGAGEDGKDGV